MSQIKGFRATYGVATSQVTVVDENGHHRELLPPPGARFEWGHMGTTASHLARAIAVELYGPDVDPKVAEHIKRHFLTGFRRQDGWELDAKAVVQYVAVRSNTRFDLMPLAPGARC